MLLGLCKRSLVTTDWLMPDFENFSATTYTNSKSPQHGPSALLGWWLRKNPELWFGLYLAPEIDAAGAFFEVNLWGLSGKRQQSRLR
jgi:hypothetical protein